MNRVDARKVAKSKINFSPYLYLIPCFIIFGVFVFMPFLKTFAYSFTLTDPIGNPVAFEGFGNYLRLFKNKEFLLSLGVTFKFAFMVGIPTFVVGFFLAVLANEKGRGSRIYEVMFSLPMAVASAPAATIWFMLLSPGPNGIVNWILNSKIRWLLDTKYALIGVSFVTVWLGVGATFIFLLTGFRNVPTELIESARVDGAGYFARLFKIITPVASPQIFFVVFLNIVNSFQAFAQIRLLTEGGPSMSTQNLIYSIYLQAIRFSRYETAFAESVILFLIILTITLVQFKLEDKVVHYQ